MHVIELFFADEDPRSRRTRRLMEEVLDEVNDTLLVCHDVEQPAGREKARTMDVREVPTTIIDRERVVVGVPTSKEQVMRTLR